MALHSAPWWVVMGRCDHCMWVAGPEWRCERGLLALHGSASLQSACWWIAVSCGNRCRWDAAPTALLGCWPCNQHRWAAYQRLVGRGIIKPSSVAPGTYNPPHTPAPLPANKRQQCLSDHLTTVTTVFNYLLRKQRLRCLCQLGPSSCY